MKRDLKTVAAFAADGPFTEAQVRWWIFNESQNGLQAEGAIVRIGRRVYIDTLAFDRWIEAQQVAA
ncbi:DNA-binding protein [Luteimonas sp. MC1782]|uniref:DNA-binding protein n=1 Tax=Luteimonas sp. MC1782 TaxID=2760305 RepID=UPI001603C976|nr:DNA-binding protein [Luteimonas sp. MC1782]MBB1471831.1 DNA-binding protein [Luteimonas sp. MC1782]